MKLICFITLFLIIFISGKSQSNNNDRFYLSLFAGNFIVGHGYITGIWTGVDGSAALSLHHNKIKGLRIGGELYFESGADKAAIYNPTPEQFMHDRYYHESNTGLTAKVSYYPFNGFMRGFHVSAGSLLVYSIRTYEKRAELIQYSPSLSIRMAELGSDDKLLPGYRLTTGYDIYFAKKWLAGVRVDFLQYHDRDLNTLWAGKVGYRF